MSWFGKAKTFLRETKAEMDKVAFPSREEVISTTVVVLVASFIMAIYLWLADVVILRAYRFVVGIFG